MFFMRSRFVDLLSESRLVGIELSQLHDLLKENQKKTRENITIYVVMKSVPHLKPRHHCTECNTGGGRISELKLRTSCPRVMIQESNRQGKK